MFSKSMQQYSITKTTVRDIVCLYLKLRKTRT